MSNSNSAKINRFSIRGKVIVLTTVLALVLTEVAMVYFSLNSASTNESTFKARADGLSATIAQVIDKDDVKALRKSVEDIYITLPEHPFSDEAETNPDYKTYIESFKSIWDNPYYLKVQQYLRDILSVNGTDFDCIYLFMLDKKLPGCVYLVDSAEDGCLPGTVDPLYEINYFLLTDESRGFPPYMTNTETYGHLVTAGHPIFDAEKNVIAYAMVDVSMTYVRSQQANRIVRLFIYLALTSILIAIVAVIFVNKFMIKPLEQLKTTASSYDATTPEKNHEAFKQLDIKNRDEIGELAHSMKRMEQDTYNKVSELMRVNDELTHSKRIAEAMKELANKDALTGLRNKTAYNGDIEEMNKHIEEGHIAPFSIAMVDLNYLKEINDELGHFCGDTALIKLANVMNATFPHSRVYRVGGDEFVVILKGSDHHNAEKLVEKFNRQIDIISNDNELPPEERISAAIGYSSYQKEDPNVEEILRRADASMYQRKRDMKQHIKPPINDK